MKGLIAFNNFDLHIIVVVVLLGGTNVWDKLMSIYNDYHLNKKKLWLQSGFLVDIDRR